MRLLVAFLFLSWCSIGGACGWDRDTKKDELALSKVGIYRILIGGFAHHGEAYYNLRIKGLEGKAESLDELNDLAVALFRVGRVEDSIAVLESALEKNSGHYPTLSNLGVAYKKGGRFEDAAAWIKLALLRSPDGHMGLGDWYLRALRWRAEIDDGSIPEVNFLGHRYDEVTMEGGKLVIPLRYSGEEEKKTYERNLKNLMRNDQTFSDGFLAMGDYLYGEDKVELAVLAYWKALKLGHRRTKDIQVRINAIDQSLAASGQTLSRESAEQSFKDGEEWLTRFKAVEAELVEKLFSPSTWQVEALMKQRGIAEPTKR